MACPVQPMLAVASTSQGGRPPISLAALDTSGLWTFDLKVDGARVIVSRSGAGVRIWGRSGSELTAHFPEVVAGLTGGASFVIDGELELTDRARTLADLLSRVASARLAARMAQVWPARVVAFDLLSWRGRRLLERPLQVRQRLLEELVAEQDAEPLVMVPRSGYGVAFAAATRMDGREGVVAKRTDSVYVPGRRMSTWVKFKNTHRVTAIAFAYTAGAGPGGFGALELAVLDAGRPVAVGSVASGLNTREITQVVRAVDAKRFPLVEIECLGRSSGGRLRQPVFIGFRTDVGYESASVDQLQSLPVST